MAEVEKEVFAKLGEISFGIGVMDTLYISCWRTVVNLFMHVAVFLKSDAILYSYLNKNRLKFTDS